MQFGIIGVILAILLTGGVLIFGAASDSADKEAMMQKDIMQKEVMEKKVPTASDVMTKDEDADEIEKSMMDKEGSLKTDAMMKEEDELLKDDSMMKDGAMMESGSTMTIKGSIQDYSPDKVALAQKGKVLLFFHASWCPVCRGLDAEAAANADIVPDGITVLKVDFDTATALRQKYGVTVQHTFVQVDASGDALTKFSDAFSYSAVFGKVQ